MSVRGRSMVNHPECFNRCLIPFLILLFLCVAVCQAGEPSVSGSRSPFDSEQSKGSLVIIGGSAQHDHDELWEEILEAAGGKGAKIAVIPAASQYPEQYGGRAVRMLNAAGADAFLVPLAPSGLSVDCQTASHDPEIVKRVRQAGGVYFIGGIQARICQALVTKEGKPSPLLGAIWDMYRRGGMVAGTSAGAAIMSRLMFRDGGLPLALMCSGVKLGKEVDQGLGFLDHDWFVDQHCLVRGRFARTLVAMSSQHVTYGIGVDENSALVVEEGGAAHILGQRGAVVMDLSKARSDPSVAGFNLQNAMLSYLNRGDALNLETLAITPSPEKLADRKIDPTAADFQPLAGRKLFFNDILANSVLPDVMRRTIEHRDGQAIGLAFDGEAAAQGPTTGFEFRFYRERDSRAWETAAFGGTDFTIQNIHLDIRPIEIHGPLYSNPSSTNPSPRVPSSPIAGGAGK